MKVTVVENSNLNELKTPMKERKQEEEKKQRCCGQARTEQQRMQRNVGLIVQQLNLFYLFSIFLSLSFHFVFAFGCHFLSLFALTE